MRTRLRMKRINAAVIEEVVEKLKRAGHIDDAKFVKAWIEWRMRENPAGGHLLSYELKAKGISDAAIVAALEERRTTYDDFEIARSMAAEKFERLKGIDRRKASKRLYDLLMRRGFEYDVVRRVIEDIVR